MPLGDPKIGGFGPYSAGGLQEQNFVFRQNHPPVFGDRFGGCGDPVRYRRDLQRSEREAAFVLIALWTRPAQLPEGMR